MAILRVNDRYGRFGVAKFRDASRRLGHPVVIEQKYLPGDTDFRRQLRVIRDSRVDGILLWADAHEAGIILSEMRELGLKQRVFGSFRTYGEDLFKYARDAAAGMEFVYPYDPNRDDPVWMDFQKRYEAKYGEKVNAFSALAFDTMNILMDAICRAGLNRGGIRDALYSVTEYRGVTGDMKFDPNEKAIRPLYLGTVHEDGKVTFREPRMDERAAYATVGEGGVSYAGPALPKLPTSELRIGVFGVDADKAAAAVKQDGFRLVPVVAGQNWGKASTELVRLVYDENVAAIVATDRRSAHLAEQIAVKAFIPVVALADDRTLTSTNIPWIFRLSAATSITEAVDALRAAVQVAGLNREAIRDALASGGRFSPVGEPMATQLPRP
jgi:ABC-type branched-subunit amino acid transport system substrate-binding protein